MTDHVIELCDTGARVHLDLGRIMIETVDGQRASVPIADVAVLLVSNPEVTITNPVLAAVATHGGITVVCDEKHRPSGMLFPLIGHSLQSRRMAAQLAATQRKKDIAWRFLVTAKIKSQAAALERLTDERAGLDELARRVRNGDPDNFEAQAAQRYWPRVFGDPTFVRDRGANDQNRLLNYGYTILRALAARWVCAAGLHPTIGVHHHGQYNAFALVDDVMEPYRACVDLIVADAVMKLGPEAPLDRAQKAALVGISEFRLQLDEEDRSLKEAIGRTAASLAMFFLGERSELSIGLP